MMSLPTGLVRSGNRNLHSDHRRRHGQTMLELVAATTIISLALTPALRLTRSSLMNIDTLEKSELSVSLCVSKLEEQMALTAATWDLTGSAGDYSSIGHPELRFISTISDAENAGGIQAGWRYWTWWFGTTKTAETTWTPMNSGHAW